MEKSPIGSAVRHPLLESDYEDSDYGEYVEKIKLDPEEELIITNSSNKKLKKKSKSETCKAVEVSSNKNGKKQSSPIEIKGSPAHKGKDGAKDSSQGSSTSNSKISFFKVLTRRNSNTNQGKHKKLGDKWLEGEPVSEGVAFCVKFLGSTLIEKAGAADAAEATKTVLQMAKAGHKPIRLGLMVSTNGITLSDPSTNEVRLEISIYDIAHCSADSSHPNVFSFIATNKNDVNECYCFATRKKKMAQHITLTIAQAFNVAFEMWQSSSIENSGESSGTGSDKVIIGSTDSGRSTGSTGSTGSDVHGWVHFDQEQVGELTTHLNSMNLVTLSPFHRPNSNPPRRPRHARSIQNHNDDLLICLN